MKLKKFNENKTESDQEIILDCATTITYEFEDIEFKFYKNEIIISLAKWVKGYGDIHLIENYLKFNVDYIKFNQLFHTFLQSLSEYFDLYIDRMIDLTFENELIFKIKFNKIGSNTFRFILDNSGEINLSLLKQYLDINVSENTSITIESKSKTILVRGLDQDKVIKNINNLDKLCNGLNDIYEIKSISIHLLNSEFNWNTFKLNKLTKDGFSKLIHDRVNREINYDTIQDEILNSNHLNISITFNQELIKNLT